MHRYQIERILNASKFLTLSDEELHYHVMSGFQTTTYCRPRIGQFLLKNLFFHLYNEYHI